MLSYEAKRILTHQNHHNEHLNQDKSLWGQFDLETLITPLSNTSGTKSQVSQDASSFHRHSKVTSKVNFTSKHHDVT